MSVVASTFVDRAATLVDRERARLLDAYGDAVGRDVRESPTPMLLLDLPAARRNIGRMAAGIAERQSAIRPHIKVHKSPDLSRLQIDAGAIGLSVATVWEAVVMAASGIDDLFVVNTVAGPLKLRALAELARERRILVAIDQVENAEAVAAAATAAGSEIGVLIEVDTGMDRAGVDAPEDAAPLAQAVARLAGLRLEGVTGYEGHCSMEDDLGVRTALQGKAMGTLLAARDAILGAGLPCPIVSAGGTRTWWLTASTPGVTEVQAGTYVVMDAFHEGLEGGFEHALHVGTTVISRAPRRLIVDVGSKTVASPALSRLVGLDVPVVRLDEEHGIFSSSDPQPPVGTFLRMIPGYGPSTVASFDVFHVVEDDRVVDIWPVIPRGPGHAGLARLLDGVGS
jgi:D-serine deaminase-like pyridoxal phosphate-dependent protein